MEFAFQRHDEYGLRLRFDMTHWKMIAIDLDGTLLCPRSTVTPRVKKAVQAAVRSGIMVVFATGRNLNECNHVLEAVDHYGAAVFVGGAIIVDTRSRTTLHRTVMQTDLARELTRMLEELGYAVLAAQDHSAGGYDYLISSGIAVNPETAQWMAVNSASHLPVEKLAEHSHEHTIRVGIVAPPSEMEPVKALIETRFGNRALALNLAVPSSGVEVLEVFDPSVNKWHGIQQIARQHGIRGEEIIAIGDDVNDIPMLKYAGLGVAMGNAKPEVRQAAKKVIGTNAEDGLAIFLEEVVALRKNFTTPNSPHATRARTLLKS